MPTTIAEAKTRLDNLIDKARIHLYKPIQIAEVLRRIRLEGNIDPLDLETYRNPSLRWRDAVTVRLLKRVSTSSARYQHDVWNETAMPPTMLAVLAHENTATQGAVERYIYLQFTERQAAVTGIIALVDTVETANFRLKDLLALFAATKGIRRSIDKAYEIVTYALFETIITSLEATVTIQIEPMRQELLKEFPELAQVLLGLKPNQTEWTFPAHLYRVGITNAADRGLDMWANFGAVVQVKHLTLNKNDAASIVEQVESDAVVIVCQDAHAEILEVVLKQIGWGKRVRGIVKESDLCLWYDHCLRGRYAGLLANPLMERLQAGFRDEFPQVAEVVEFCNERGYLTLAVPELWQTANDKVIEESKET